MQNIIDSEYRTARIVIQDKTKIANTNKDQFENALFLLSDENRKGAGGLRTKGHFKKSHENKPLITVITIVYNGEKYLEGTILSVLNQTYDNVEYIIIDGGSTDGTLDIVQKYEHFIDYWISEKDQGISDAFNKGIMAAQGEWIGLLNADDFYESTAIETVMKSLNNSYGFMFGGCTYIKDDGEQTYIQPDSDYTSKISYVMPRIHHPTIFVHQSVYSTYGGFDLSYKIAMDYDFFLRLHKAGIHGLAIHKNIAYMREIGISVTMYKKARIEVRDISIKHGLNPILAHGIYFLLMIKHHLRSFLNRTNS